MPSKTQNPTASPSSSGKKGQTSSETKKPTPTQVKAELEDLKESTRALRAQARDREILIQRAKDILKQEGTPGMSMNQDHHRLATQVKELRKLLEVNPEEIYGGL